MKKVSLLVAAALCISSTLSTTLGAQSPQEPKAASHSILATTTRAVHESIVKAQGVSAKPRPFSETMLAQDGQNAAPDSKAFLKSTKGMVVLAILGVGVGYGAYSKVHDRVHTRNANR